jgi:hypothetical protein
MISVEGDAAFLQKLTFLAKEMLIFYRKPPFPSKEMLVFYRKLPFPSKEILIFYRKLILRIASQAMLYKGLRDLLNYKSAGEHRKA